MTASQKYHIVPLAFPSPLCTHCNLLKVQNVEHLATVCPATVCPATKLEGGFQAIHQMNDEFKSWIKETTY